MASRTADPPVHTTLALSARGRVGAARLAIVQTHAFWWIVGLVWAATNAMLSRNEMNPDGMSYVDVALEAVRSGPGALINSYWSPAYPAFLALWFKAAQPSPENWYPLVHVANFAIFAVTLGAFTFFLTAWTKLLEVRWPEFGPLLGSFRPFGYALFLWHSMQLIGPGVVSPDMAVMAVVLWIVGLGCRIAVEESTGRYAQLGAAFALGFWVKAAMLPLAVLGLGALWLFPLGGLRRNRLAITAAVFFAGIAPWVGVMSAHEGRFSMGASGTLNYVWFVNQFEQYKGWTEAGEHGVPVHAPQVLSQSPRVLTFDAALPGTFPLWFDAGKWYRGVRPVFDWADQWGALGRTWELYLVMLQFMNGLWGGALLLAVLLLRDQRWPGWNPVLRWQVLWPLAACGMYAVVYVEPRFVAAFFLLLWMALFAALAVRVPLKVAQVIMGAVAAVMLIPAVGLSAVAARFEIPDLLAGVQAANVRIASELAQKRLGPGDRVAVIGDAFDWYALQLAKVKVTAEISHPEEWAAATSESREVVVAKLKSVGMTALLAKGPVEGACWQSLAADTDVKFRMLDGSCPDGH